MNIPLHSLAVLTTILMIGNANAADYPMSYCSLAIGRVGVFDEGIDDPEALKLEYRLTSRWTWQLAPLIGIARSENSASFVFVALEKDFPLNEHWVPAISWNST